MFRLSSIVAVTFLITNISASPVLPLPPDYQFFNSSIYPGYGVRFVNPTMCDPNVTQYAGYLDMGADHHYFWFFESKQNPGENPVTLWVNGGPGCTDQIGIWLDNGPCKTRDGSTIEFRENTWTHYSNMLYIDQPTGTGFSYGDTIPRTLDQSTPVFYKALQLFYEAFPKYNKLPLHIFGESFGGRMAPLIANYIIEKNLELKEAIAEDEVSKQIIPLKTIALANGWINPKIQNAVNVELMCNSKFGLTLSQETCVQLKLLDEACESLNKKCHESGDRFRCGITDIYCGNNFLELFKTSGRNIFNIKESSDNFDLMKNEHRGEEYLILLNRPDIQRSIGAIYKNLERCEQIKVNLLMKTYGEGIISTAPTIEALLQYGIPVLVYVGDQDFSANWYGQMEVLSKLNFNGSEQYNQLQLRPWVVKDKEAGMVKGTDKLTFLRVYEAGHEVVYNQPENALVMFDNWVNGKPF